MGIPLTLLLIVVLVSGLGLFIRAYVSGMRFADRREAQKKQAAESSKSDSGDA